MEKITLTKKDAQKLAKAANTMRESFQSLADAAKEAALIFERFGATVEQLELPTGKSEE